MQLTNLNLSEVFLQSVAECCEALGPFPLRSVDLQAEQSFPCAAALKSKRNAYPPEQTATVSCLSCKARERHWGSRWVLEKMQKHPGSAPVTSSIALGCSRLWLTGLMSQVPASHALPDTPIPTHTTSFGCWRVQQDLLAGKEEVPQAVLTDTARVRSSKGGILRAGASKLCVEEGIVGMTRGVGTKCCITNPILSSVDVCNFHKQFKMNGKQ